MEVIDTSFVMKMFCHHNYKSFMKIFYGLILCRYTSDEIADMIVNNNHLLKMARHNTLDCILESMLKELISYCRVYQGLAHDGKEIICRMYSSANHSFTIKKSDDPSYYATNILGTNNSQKKISMALESIFKQLKFNEEIPEKIDPNLPGLIAMIFILRFIVPIPTGINNPYPIDINFICDEIPFITFYIPEDKKLMVCFNKDYKFNDAMCHYKYKNEILKDDRIQKLLLDDDPSCNLATELSFYLDLPDEESLSIFHRYILKSL